MYILAWRRQFFTERFLSHAWPRNSLSLPPPALSFRPPAHLLWVCSLSMKNVFEMKFSTRKELVVVLMSIDYFFSVSITCSQSTWFTNLYVHTHVDSTGTFGMLPTDTSLCLSISDPPRPSLTALKGWWRGLWHRWHEDPSQQIYWGLLSTFGWHTEQTLLEWYLELCFRRMILGAVL